MKLKQDGRINFEGKESAQFWIRAFQLEEEVKNIQQMIIAENQMAKALVPIIAEYECGPDFKWIYVISLQIDMLGLIDGLGIVYYASPENYSKAYEARDKFADDVLESLRKSEKLREMRVIPEGKEKP
jgi:hypothetical protein